MAFDPTMKSVQDVVDAYPDWYHEIDFGGGVRSKARFPSENNRLIWMEIERFLGGVDFAGKTVLDIGCWDGMWSFLAERRGARRVLGVDAVDQRWGTSGGFEIARSILKSRVEYRGDFNIYSAREFLGGERFDIVLFLGVYYHLTDAIHAFSQLRHAVAEGGVAIVEGSAINDTERAYAEFLCGPGPEPERCDASNWTIPTRRWLADVLDASYFSVRREQFPFKGGRGRVLIEAEARTGTNQHHPFPPPFGLHEYDLRWRGGGTGE